MLERHGVPVRLDDHSSPRTLGVRRWGHVRVLVPDADVAKALELLASHVAEERRDRYMRLV
jgi:hypothetical protein